jgi:hypothetical protein
MTSVGFETGIPVVERLQPYTLDCTATGIGAHPVTTYNKGTNVHGCRFKLGAAGRRDACRHVPDKTSFESRTEVHFIVQSIVLLLHSPTFLNNHNSYLSLRSTVVTPCSSHYSIQEVCIVPVTLLCLEILKTNRECLSEPF